MNKIINIITTIVLFIVILGNYDCILSCFGGSFVLVPLYVILFFKSFHYDRFKKEISFFLILCLLMLGYNKIAYMEINRLYEPRHLYFIVYSLTMGVILLSQIMARSAIWFPISDKEGYFDKRYNEISAIYLRYYLVTFSGMIVVWATGVCFEGNYNYLSYLYKNIPLSLSAILIMIIFSIGTMKVMAGIPAKYYLYLFSGAKKTKLPFDKKCFIYGWILILLVGSGIEIMRGFWLLWIGTIVLPTTLVASLWQIWRYVFRDDSKDANIRRGKNSINDAAFILKYIIIFPLVLLIYTFILSSVLGQ